MLCVVPWYAHVWGLVATAIAVAVLVLLAATLGWWLLIFAIVVGAPIYFGSRRWARRRFG